MKFIEKIVFVSAVLVFAAAGFTGSVSAQSRDRVIKQTSSQPVNMPKPVQTEQTQTASRPALTNRIILVTPEAANPLVKKTSSSRPVNMPTVNTVTASAGALTNEPVVKKIVSSAPVNLPVATNAATTNAAATAIKTANTSSTMNTVAVMAAAGRTVYGAATSAKIDQAIKSRYGIHYRYGSTGPNAYDCSGFVWSVFQEAGLGFTRASARSLWAQSEPVYGDDRFKYGTLVFFNNLGHMGIVADEKGFYQASSSKGITYSPFEGYWQGRVVGYRRLKSAPTLSVTAPATPTTVSPNTATAVPVLER